MYIKRNIEKVLKRYAKFPVVALLGPRQSGKTTLVRHYFKNHTFISFEKPNYREYAKTDPEGFLKEYANEHGIILDEFQYVPEILSYIQLEVDEKKRPGYFILTGSQNFLADQSIVQSLAGRVGILTLLPFSIDELKNANLLTDRAVQLIIKGEYPRIYSEDLDVSDFYSSYIHTYLEKDIRQLINVDDLLVFQKFVALCAGRIGQEVNFNELGSLSGISAVTTKKWLSILQASYIIFFLQPHFTNFNKRITKSPKLYFYDTGIACNLLKIHSSNHLVNSPFKGALFENLIINDLYKQFFNMGKDPSVYFWRDQNGRIEVDAIIDFGVKLSPVEIKASETISMSFFDALLRWNEISNTLPENNYVVYAGDENQKRKKGQIISWLSEATLVEKLSK